MSKENTTILVLCLALVVLNLLTGNIVFLYISLGLGLLCLLSPLLAQKIDWIWMKLSLLIGAISSAIILAIVFFTVVTIISFIARLAGKKFIQLRRSKSSYFKEMGFFFNKESFENMW